MNDIPVFLSVYVEAPVTIGTLHIGSYEVSYGYTSDVLSVIFITMKFVTEQHVLALKYILLVAKYPGCGSNIVHLLLE